MLRGLPYSLAVHVLALVLVILFGNTVNRPPVQPPRAIRVKMVHLPELKPQQQEPRPQVSEPPPPRQQEKVPDLPPKEVPEAKPQPEKKPVKPVEKIVEQEPEPQQEPVEETPDPVPAATPITMGPSVEATDSDFPYDWYLRNVQGMIARNWNPRQLGFGKRAVVSCAVHFQVARGGAVSQVTLVRRSGIGVFDRESLRAVQTTRLPPLPPQYSGSTLGVTFIFNLEPGS